jgi:hypothetical protein
LAEKKYKKIMEYFNSGYPLTVMEALRGLYAEVIFYLPSLVVAVIVLIVGWLVGMALGSLVKRLLTLIQIDTFANQLGMDKLSARAGRSFSIARLGEWVVKWFFFLASFVAAADILGLQDVSVFLYSQVLPYAGHVVVAMAILLLGMLAANFFGDIMAAAVRASGVVSSAVIGSLTRWSIIAFAVIAALAQLQLATTFLQDLFRAVVAMLAIAGGLAFGLGGRDHAKKILDAIEQGMRKE